MMEWTNDVIFEFLTLYKNEPALWNTSSPQHKNRNDVHDAWLRIQTNLKSGTIPITELKKKKENLMSTYRKQKAKIKESTKTGSGSDIYKPEWPFYDIMSKFMDDVYKPKKTKTTIMEAVGHRKVIKRKAIISDTQMQLMKVCTEALKKKEMSEFDCFAVSVGKKLEKMDSFQALYAESIILSVLRRGLLNRLTEATDVCDKQCNKNVYFSPRPSSATSSDHAVVMDHVQGGEVPQSVNSYDDLCEIEASVVKMEPE